MNLVSIDFVPCSPAPVNGYQIRWRVAGSADSYTDEGNFFASPAQFIDSINPPGTQYEGFIRSDCGGGIYGNDVPFSTVTESSSSGSVAICRMHDFQVFGSDGSSVHLTGTFCDGSPYEYLGLVGDGAPPSVCLQLGTVNTNASNVIVVNDTTPC